MVLGFLRIESFKRGIVISSAFGFVSKLLIFFQSVVIAYYFGAQVKTDIFFFCYASISLLAALFNNLDISVLIPEAMRQNQQNGGGASNCFLNFFIWLYLFIGLVFTMVWLVSPVDIFMLITNFDLESLQRNKEILLLSIPLFGLMIITNLMGNILTSFKFFTVPMIIGAINGIIVLGSLFIFHDRFGILSVLMGQLVAYTGSIVFLAFLMKSNLKWSFAFKRINVGEGILNNILFAQAGNITSTLASYIPLFLLSAFGSGTITSLTYGQRIAELPNQLISSQVSSVVGIQFNELYAKRNLELLSSVFKTTVRLLLFILIPICFIMWLYSNDIVTILLERGAFNVNSSKNVSEFLKYFGFLLPSLFINSIVARLFMATQKVKQAFWYQIVLNLVSILMMIVLIDKVGIIGYPIALLIVGLSNICFCYFLVGRFFPFIDYLDVLDYLFKVLCFNGVIFIVILFVKVQLVTSSSSVIQLIVGFLLYVTLLLVGNSLLNLNSEVRDFLKIKLRSFN